MGPIIVSVTGLIEQGADKVFVNDLPIARLGDGGTHACCVGSQSFIISSGSSNYFVNNLPVARSGDQTTHCGSD